MTPKQERFVEEYLVDLNAMAAYKRAGYKAKGNAAEVNAARLLRNAQVAEAIEKAQGERSKRLQIEADDVMRELARLGFHDVRKLFTSDGKLRSVHDLDGDIAAAVTSIEVVTRTLPTKDGEEPEVEYIHKIKLADKIKPLELIGKHLGKRLGQWADKVEYEAGDGLKSLAELAAEVARRDHPKS